LKEKAIWLERVELEEQRGSFENEGGPATNSAVTW